MLKAHGVDIVFGLCGDTSLPLYDALARSGSMRHILTRDERHAAYMADGYARVTGKVGVCEGPSGGGATYILPGLVEANESSVPILAINTDVAVSSRNRFTLTELDQRSLMRPLTKWNAVLDRAADIPRTFRAAFEAMTTGRPGAAHIALPFDVQNAPVERGDVWADPTLGAFPSRRVAPDPFAIELAAKLLRGARHPVIICGGGVVLSAAETELMGLAEKISAPVATTVSGKGSIDERCAHSVGVVGSNGGTPQTRAVVDQADVVVFVGCRAGSVTTERWRHPAPGRARIVHIDVDPAVPGTNYKVDVPIIGDARLSLSALAEAATPRVGDLSWVDEKKREKFEAFEALAKSNDVPIKPERVVSTLDKILAKDAIVVADPGTPCPYFSAYYVVKGSGRRFFSNRAHGGEDRGGDGRRQLRHVRGRARDGGAPEAADHVHRDLERNLRLDQGGAEIGLRPALFLGRFRRHRSREGSRGIRCQELEGDPTAIPCFGSRRSAAARRPDARRHRLPAAARGTCPGVGMGRMKENPVVRSHHDMGGLPAQKVEPTEHDYEEWERRVDALMVLCVGISGEKRGKQRLMTVDELRKNIESLPPETYDRTAYYEKWITSLTHTLIQRGVITTAELARKMEEVSRRA